MQVKFVSIICEHTISGNTEMQLSISYKNDHYEIMKCINGVWNEFILENRSKLSKNNQVKSLIPIIVNQCRSISHENNHIPFKVWIMEPEKILLFESEIEWSLFKTRNKETEINMSVLEKSLLNL